MIGRKGDRATVIANVETRQQVTLEYADTIHKHISTVKSLKEVDKQLVHLSTLPRIDDDEIEKVTNGTNFHRNSSVIPTFAICSNAKDGTVAQVLDAGFFKLHLLSQEYAVWSPSEETYKFNRNRKFATQFLQQKDMEMQDAILSKIAAANQSKTLVVPELVRSGSRESRQRTLSRTPSNSLNVSEIRDRSSSSSSSTHRNGDQQLCEGVSDAEMNEPKFCLGTKCSDTFKRALEEIADGPVVVDEKGARAKILQFQIKKPPTTGNLS